MAPRPRIEAGTIDKYPAALSGGRRAALVRKLVKARLEENKGMPAPRGETKARARAPSSDPEHPPRGTSP